MEVRGETPAQPGVEREWVASYWPVRAAAGGELIGVGAVVFDVTDRRAAERALRTQTDRYETLLEALSEVGEGMVVIEDGRCVYANHAFEQLSGYTFPELTALESLYELVEPEERAEAERRARLRTERDLVDTTYTLAIRRRDGGRVMLELAGVPLEIAGPPARRQLVVVVRDITARRRAEAERERLLARFALLAEASALFDQSLDEERTLRSVAELCVRDLADTCVVVLGGYPGPARRTIAVARDPERERALAAEPVLDGRPGDPVAEVLRTGAPQRRRRARGRPAERARARARRARRRTSTALGAARREDALALLEDLGRRAALALDNARLYAERSAIATTLQRSLLPPDLPRIPGAQLAARYLASGDGIEIGGDFYDCFATGGGDWALVIGDVCGKGAEAAAITALARYTLRAVGPAQPAPRAGAGGAQRGAAAPGPRLPLLHRAVRLGHAAPRRLRRRAGHGRAPAPAGAARRRRGRAGRRAGDAAGHRPRARDLRGARLARPRRRARALHGRRRRGQPGRRGARARAARGAAAHAARGATRARSPRPIERKALAVQDGRLRDDVAVVVLRVGQAVCRARGQG